MRLPVALPAGTARFWVAAAVPALAVIVGAYLLETHGRTIAAAALVAGGMAIAAGRFLVSHRADRRYAKVLESEVATQTRSLMDSLAATAGAERNLRLVMRSEEHRLNSSHLVISYAVFCLKKKKNKQTQDYIH